MNPIKIIIGVAGMSLLLGTGVLAEMTGGEGHTSKDPSDNVPDKIQRSQNYMPDKGEGFKDGSGPGTRSDELVGMDKEDPNSVTGKELEQNVENTDGGGAAMAAEELHEKSKSQSHQGISAQSSKKGTGHSSE